MLKAAIIWSIVIAVKVLDAHQNLGMSTPFFHCRFVEGVCVFVIHHKHFSHYLVHDPHPFHGWLI